MDFLALFKEAGFVDVEVVGETGFNSSSITKGMLFRATKSLASNAKSVQKDAATLFSEAKTLPIKTEKEEAPDSEQTCVPT